MNCDEVVVRVSADMDGELTERESLEVAHHVRGCIECARKRALLEQARLEFRRDALDRPRTHYVGVFAVSLALAIVVTMGLMLLRSPKPPAAPNDPGRLIAIDCGKAGSTDCLVEQPCHDVRCSAAGMPAGL